MGKDGAKTAGLLLGLVVAIGAAAPVDARSTRAMIFTSPGSRDPATSPPAHVLADEILHWTDLVWTGWGSATATATGDGVFDETGYTAAVELVADRLRRCGGHRLYTRITATYPTDPTVPGGSQIRRCRVFLLANGASLGEFAPREKPSRFSLGDASFRSFAWRGWGTRKATGTGRVTAFNATRVPARLELRDAGACAGRSELAYRQATFRLRINGRWQTNRWDLCP